MVCAELNREEMLVKKLGLLLPSFFPLAPLLSALCRLRRLGLVGVTLALVLLAGGVGSAVVVSFSGVESLAEVGCGCAGKGKFLPPSRVSSGER